MHVQHGRVRGRGLERGLGLGLGLLDMDLDQDVDIDVTTIRKNTGARNPAELAVALLNKHLNCCGSASKAVTFGAHLCKGV